MTQNPMYPPPPPGMPGAAGYGFPQQPKQGNGFAIAGLVFGIIGFCVPFLGGFIGLILGIIGFRKTSNPAVGGRGLSIAAIIVACLGMVISTVVALSIAGGAYGLVRATAVPRATAHTFIQDLANGNIPAARANAADSISDADLDAMSKQLMSHGTYVDTVLVGVGIVSQNGHRTCNVGGAATFKGGSASCTIELTETGDTWKVSKATFQ